MKKRYLCRMCGKETPEKRAVLIDYGGALAKVGVLCRDCYDQIGLMYVEEHDYRRAEMP